jgi:indole-3-glycerol phosphate synthase
MSAEFLVRVMDGKRRQMSLLGDAERDAARDAALAHRAGCRARFHAELLARPTAIIAEFKRHSPSAGAIQAGADPVALARLYQAGGAAAMSVLTEPDHFKGSLEDLRRVSAAVTLPLLRKDFAVDRHQVYEAALAGAEAVLVIIAGLSDAEALKLLDAAHRTNLDALVEVHTAEELQRAASLGARLIGVNNRNLKTLQVDLETSLRLAELAPPGATLVAESGLRTRADIERLQAAGYRAFLIGETLMRAADPQAALSSLQGLEQAQ